MELIQYIKQGHNINDLTPDSIKYKNQDWNISEIGKVIKNENGFILQFRLKGESFWREVNSSWFEVVV